MCFVNQNVHYFYFISHTHWNDRHPLPASTSPYISGLVSGALPTPHPSPHSSHLASWPLGLGCTQSPPSPKMKCFFMQTGVGSGMKLGVPSAVRRIWFPTPTTFLLTYIKAQLRTLQINPCAGEKKALSSNSCPTSGFSITLTLSTSCSNQIGISLASDLTLSPVMCLLCFGCGLFPPAFNCQCKDIERCCNF